MAGQDGTVHERAREIEPASEGAPLLLIGLCALIGLAALITAVAVGVPLCGTPAAKPALEDSGFILSSAEDGDSALEDEGAGPTEPAVVEKSELERIATAPPQSPLLRRERRQ